MPPGTPRSFASSIQKHKNKTKWKTQPKNAHAQMPFLNLQPAAAATTAPAKDVPAAAPAALKEKRREAIASRL